MLKTIAIALVAAGLVAIPAFAKIAPASQPQVKTVTTLKHAVKHAHKMRAKHHAVRKHAAKHVRTHVRASGRKAS